MHYNQQLLNLARGPLGLQAMGRPWGQKIGSNDKYNEWKLFVGQVPLEVRALSFYPNFLCIGVPLFKSLCLPGGNTSFKIESRVIAPILICFKALAPLA